jgi:putative ABC transport system ATP-binding protein
MLLKMIDVRRTFRRASQEVRALDRVSLELSPGNFLAIRGPSGCGKSTLLLTCGGLLRPDSGQVELLGKDLYQLSPNSRAELRATGVGFVFQQFHLVPYLHVLDNVLAATLGLPSSNGASTRTGRSEGMPGSADSAGGTIDGPSVRAVRERAMELLERFGLADRRLHVPARLSVGERQRTALARALLNRPQLLLADEPTGNLDDANAEIVWQCLAEFAGGGGAVLLVTHDQRAARIAQVTREMTAGQLASPSVSKEPA